MKTFNEIFIKAEKDYITKKAAKCWMYCFKWMIISTLLITFWPWGAPSYWILIIFPIIAGFAVRSAVHQDRKLDEKGLDLSGLSGIVISDRNIGKATDHVHRN